MADKKLEKGLVNFFQIIKSNNGQIQKILFSPSMAQKLQFYPDIIPLEKRIEKVRVDHEDPLGDVHASVEDTENFYIFNIPVEINFALKEGALIELNNNETIIIKGI